MNDIVAKGGIITATDQKHNNKGWYIELSTSQSIKLLKIFNFSVFSSEMGRSVWNLVYDFDVGLKFKSFVSAKDEVTHCVHAMWPSNARAGL